MPLITPDEARRQVRGDPPDDEELTFMSRAAERAAMRFLNRIVYETPEDLATGRTDGAARAAAAQEALTAALEADYADQWARTAAMRQARVDFIRETDAAREMTDGTVIVDDIKIAMLLIVGHFFLNRESVVEGTFMELPMGARSLLWPYRVGLGI